MSLLVAALVVAGSAFCGGLLMRRMGASGKEPEEELQKVPRVPNPFASFLAGLGDVIVAMDGEEAWLAGALLLSEEAPALAIFISPNAGGDRAVLIRPKPEEHIVWLDPVSGGVLSFGAEPPSSVEHLGELYERTRRLPFRVERHGTGAPDVGQNVIFAEYKSQLGGSLVLLAGERERLAFSGRVLGPGMYDVLPSGDST